MSSLDMATNPSGDGTPMQGPCTATFGNGMSATYGRIDGYVWSVVPAGTTSCGTNDSNHIRVEVQMKGAYYTFAVPDASDVTMLEKDMTTKEFPTAWSEGWNTGASFAFDYPTIGIHSTDTGWSASNAAIRNTLTDELSKANHISIYNTGYSSSGGHLIHRSTSGATGLDGAIVLNPLSATPHIIFFKFATETF
jgi:hypothetical protein